MLVVNNVTKKYGKLIANDNISFRVEAGEVSLLLGPNGAGKSTTMNIITGCIAATEGNVKIFGYDIYEDACDAKRQIGYLPEQPPLYDDMTPSEYLRFVGMAKGLRGAQLHEQIGTVGEVTGITEVRDRLLKNLSKGYRQRVGIAQALLGDPKLIILDEPTVGLDPRQIIEIRELIRSLGRDHMVILSSHNLSEVQAVCGHIMIISEGRLVASDTAENLEKLLTGSTSLKLTARASREEAAEVLQGAGFVAETEESRDGNGKIQITVQTSGDIDEAAEKLFFAFAEKRLPILSINQVTASLEDVFLELTDGHDPDDADSVPVGPENTHEKGDENGLDIHP